MNKKVIILFVTIFLFSFSVSALEWSNANIPITIGNPSPFTYAGTEVRLNNSFTSLNVSDNLFVRSGGVEVRTTPATIGLLNLYNTSSMSGKSYLNISRTGNPRPILYINDWGYIGINTEAPNLPLTIRQPLDNTGIRLYGYDDMSTKYMDFSINGGGAPVISTSGGALFYNSDVQLFNSKYQVFGASYQTYSMGYDGTNKYYRLRTNFAEGSHPNTSITRNVYMINDGTDDLTIPDGNLGIGVTYPLTRLHIAGNVSLATTSGNVTIGSTTSPVTLSIIGNTNFTTYSDSTTAYTFYNKTGYPSVVIDTLNNRMGIGVIPEVALHIKDFKDGYTEMKLDGTAVGGKKWTIGTGYSGDGISISDFYWYLDGTPAGIKMILTPDGNFSIGTTKPNQKFVVQNTGAGIVANFTTTTGQGNITMKSPNGREWIVGVNDAGQWVIS